MNPDPGRVRFERLSLPLHDDIYRAARALLKSDSDALDLVQETYLRAYRGFPDYKEERHFKAWIFSILRNAYIDIYRRRKNQPAQLDLDSPAAEPEAPPLPKELLPDDVAAALDRLRPAHHLVLLLREIQGFSYKEIAEVMGVPIGTVMSGLHQARKALQKELAGKTT